MPINNLPPRNVNLSMSPSLLKFIEGYQSYENRAASVSSVLITLIEIGLEAWETDNEVSVGICPSCGKGVVPECTHGAGIGEGRFGEDVDVCSCTCPSCGCGGSDEDFVSPSKYLREERNANK